MISTQRRWLRRVVSGGLVLLLVCGVGLLPLPAIAAAVPYDNGATVVSLTFDDAYASQLNAQRLLAAHNMKGTFFAPTGFIGLEGRLTLPQLQAIQRDGNEIGGHTVNHLHLPQIDPAEQARQICDDRVALARDGLTVTSFAYPFGSFDERSEQIVKDCGYNSARAEGRLFAGGACESCAIAESIPPADPYAVRTATPVVATTSLSSIQEQITDAMTHGGGWMPIVFHEVCDQCSDMAITERDF